MNSATFLPMTRVLSRFLAFAASLGLAACDAQAPIDYIGESLLSVQGSVQLDPQTDTRALQPALAFWSEELEALHIIDVDVSGEFPNRFQFGVYAPPPDDSFVMWKTGNETGRMAFGFVTAVAADHPEYAPMASSSSSTTCLDTGCDEQRTFCIGQGDAKQCYVERLRCPIAGADADALDCDRISSEGDPSIANQPWSTLAGISENYVVIYFEEPSAAGSPIAHTLGFEGGVAAGYHLLAVRLPTEAEEELAKACDARAKQIAVERYNAAHGTALTVWDLTTHICTNNVCSAGDPEEFNALRAGAGFELKCPNTDHVFAPLADPASHSISVRLGRDLQATLLL